MSDTDKLRVILEHVKIPFTTAPGQLKFVELFQLLREFYPRFNQRKIDEIQESTRRVMK